MHAGKTKKTNSEIVKAKKILKPKIKKISEIKFYDYAYVKGKTTKTSPGNSMLP